jgi:hypothetical protein
MGTARPIGRCIGAVIGLVALVAVAIPAGAGSPGGPGPVVGPDLPISYPVPGSPEPTGGNPAIAFGGSVHLTVWISGNGGIRAARVDRAGTVVDRPGLLVTSSIPQNLDVASDGQNFLVVWETFDGIFGRRVSQQGVLLDPAPIPLSSGSQRERGPAVAFDGTNYLVIWTGNIEGSATFGDIYGTRVSPAGVVLDPDELAISTAVPEQVSADLAFNGTNYLVAWESYDGVEQHIVATLVTTAGTALDPDGFPVATSSPQLFSPAVAALDTSFLVVWDDFSAHDVSGTRVDAAGTVLDPTGIPIGTTADDEFGRPAVASDGVHVLVLFLVDFESLTLRAVRVDASGTVLDVPAIPVPGVESGPAVAFDGDNHFVVGRDRNSVRGTRMTQAGAVLDPAGIAIATAANSQTGIDLAFDGSNHLTVWFDDRVSGSGRGLYGARVGPDGQILDGTGFPIATGAPESNDPVDASVAFDGTNYLVTWAEEERHVIRAARVTGDGTVLDRFVVAGPTPDRLFLPAVAFGDGVFLVAWLREQPISESPSDVHAARVSPAGEVLDPAPLILAEGYAGEPDIAFGDTDFLVVWADGRNFPERNVFATRVTPAGTVLTPTGFPLSAGERWKFSPRVAWNGDRYLVVWTDVDGFNEATSDIGGTRVDGSGAVLDPAGIPISTAPGQQQVPEVAANGWFLVTWTDRRRGELFDSDLFATRVDPTGTVAQPDGLEVVHSRGANSDVGAPVAAAAQNGTFAVAYERRVPDPPYATTRVLIRKVNPK